MIWRHSARFRVPADPTWQRLHHQCSLAIEPNSFMLAIDGRAQLINGTESPYTATTKFMLSAWPQNIPDQLPLDDLTPLPVAQLPRAGEADTAGSVP
jgi:hypothetical protein